MKNVHFKIAQKLCDFAKIYQKNEVSNISAII